MLELVTNRFPFPTDLAAIELMMYIVQNEVRDCFVNASRVAVS